MIAVIVFVLLTISYRNGVLPPNFEVSLEGDFIQLTQPPAEVALLLKNHCYNCHSAKASYPLKAHFAPFHQKYLEPVKQGREKLNFSTWSSYEPEMQKVLLLVAVEQMENHVMPKKDVFPKGSDTLSPPQEQLLIQWLAQEAEAGMN